MKHRTGLPEKERRARSQPTRLIHDKPLMVGGMGEIANTCGKPDFKCTRGEKHKSWHLSLRHKGKRKMFPVLRACEDEIFQGVKTYQELWKQREVVSEANGERIRRGWGSVSSGDCRDTLTWHR